MSKSVGNGAVADRREGGIMEGVGSVIGLVMLASGGAIVVGGICAMLGCHYLGQLAVLARQRNRVLVDQMNSLRRQVELQEWTGKMIAGLRQDLERDQDQ